MNTNQNEKALDAYTIKLDDYVMDMSWSFDNKFLCIALASGKLSVVSINNQKIMYTVLAHEIGILSVTHSPTSSVFLTAGQDGTVKLWETISGKLLKNLIGGWQWVEHIKWSPDGKYFIFGSGKHLKLYTDAGEYVWEFINPESTISALSWNKESQSFAVGSYGNLKIFNVEKGTPSDILPWQNSLISLAWSPDGKFICAGTQDARIHFWPLPYFPESDCEMSGYAGKVKELSWNYNSELLASNCGAEIVVWKVNGKAPVGEKPIVLQGHKYRITTLKYSNNSELLVSGDTKGIFLFWYPKKYANMLTGGTIEGSITALSWSPDDQSVVVASSQGDLVIVDTPI